MPTELNVIHHSSEQNPNVIPLVVQQEVQKPSEDESLAQRATRRLFGDTPTEGLAFRQAIMFITDEKHHHLLRALKKFCRYLSDDLGWTTEKIDAWLAEPENGQRWNQMQLVSHRFAFSKWWTTKKQQTRRRLVRNLRKGKS
jgi:hypothetical protein